MKAKFLFIVTSIMLFPCALFAQGTEPSTFTVDLGTFTGLIAVVTFLVTQLAKLIPYVSSHKWMKIVTSIVVGALVCVGCWATGLTPFLEGLPIWQVLIYGVGAGLSGCGFYAIVKPFLDMLPKAQEVDPDDEKY